uniref:Uncharacterized protein n=1 Tax=Sparus aurata TaxID=8175 RepID=A0A671XVT0_SPAAU
WCICFLIFIYVCVFVTLAPQYTHKLLNICFWLLVCVRQTDSNWENLYVCACVWPCVCVCVSVCDRLTSGKLLIWLRGNFPSRVVTTMLRVKSSLSASRTALMSASTSSRLMMSSTSAELIFTLADWPFALAWKTKRGERRKAVREEWRL